MKYTTAFIAALLLPSCVFAQAYSQDPMTGRRFDQYGRPMPSLEQLCREGQMAGGPLTLQCAQNDYRFNRKGERLVYYHFERWGYGFLDAGMPESVAQRLDSDPAFRSKYIKQHGIDKYPLNKTSPDTIIAPIAKDSSGDQCRSESDLAYEVAQASAKGIPIQNVRDRVAKILDENHVSTEAYNAQILMVNRAYAWQKHGYTLDQVRDADFQACRGTPVLEIPAIEQ
jgi:hypothetical protein